jgi:RHS repeat-associated protein
VRWSEGSPLDQGYCGSLQHRRDAESGLVYMRARYYEPWTGRFLSEDPAMDGANWYVYCANDPVNSVDPSGREPITTVVGFWEWAEKIFASWGIDLPNLPKSATIVANTIATVEMFASLATGADFVARTASVATASSMFLIGSSFAWVPAMCSLAASGARFAGILFRVIALVTFAQCALLMYIAEMDAYCEAGV